MYELLPLDDPENSYNWILEQDLPTLRRELKSTQNFIWQVCDALLRDITPLPDNERIPIEEDLDNATRLYQQILTRIKELDGVS